MFLKLAILNMRKHAKRTILIVFAVLLSIVVMLVVESMMEGMRESFFRNLYRNTGHVQLHGKGYADRVNPRSLQYTIADPDKVIDEIERLDLVLHAKKIIEFGGLVIQGERNIPLIGVGIARDSTFFVDVREGLQEGTMPEDPEDITLSAPTAEVLGVGMAGEVIVLSQDSAGRPYYRQYAVAGIFKTGSPEFDDRRFFLTHSEAANLLYLGEKTIEIRVQLVSPDAAGEFVERTEEIASQYQIEAVTWRDIHGSFAVALEFFDIFKFVIDLLVVIVAATVITNAILMNVFERTAEYGTLRAIGLKKKQQLLIIMSEGALEGFAGSLGGLAVGVPLILILRQYGIDIGEIASGFGLDPVLRFAVEPGQIIRSFVAGGLIAVAGSLYAAFISVRMPIVEMFGGSQ